MREDDRFDKFQSEPGQGLWRESATFFNKRAVLHLPAYRNGEEPQNVDTVSFFMRLHRGIG